MSTQMRAKENTDTDEEKQKHLTVFFEKQNMLKVSKLI